MVTCWPSFIRSKGPGALPLYPTVWIIWPGASSRLTEAIRSEKCVTLPICLEADVEEETFRLRGKEQPGEKTDAPDNADKRAKRRNSRRFMTSPSMALSYEQYSAVPESLKRPPKILNKRNARCVFARRSHGGSLSHAGAPAGSGCADRYS